MTSSTPEVPGFIYVGAQIIWDRPEREDAQQSLFQGRMPFKTPPKDFPWTVRGYSVERPSYDAAEGAPPTLSLHLERLFENSSTTLTAEFNAKTMRPVEAPADTLAKSRPVDVTAKTPITPVKPVVFKSPKRD